MAPLHVNVSDSLWVYCCQTEGCPERPSSLVQPSAPMYTVPIWAWNAHVLFVLSLLQKRKKKRKPCCLLFLHPIYKLCLKESCCYSVSINCNVAASIDTLSQVLQMFIILLYTPSSGSYLPDTHRTSVGSCLFWFPWWAAVLRQNILWSTPPAKYPPQSQHRWYPH